MVRKVLFWLGSEFTHFCLSHYLQKIIDDEFYAIIDITNKPKSFFKNQKLKNGTERIFLKIPFEIAPIKAAILPLNAKDNLPEKAMLLYDELKTFFNIQYDEKDSIGKRYRRQDAIGTPYCITFDYDTLKDNSVTIRNRNSMVQERVLLSSTKDYIINNVSIDNLLTQV